MLRPRVSIFYAALIALPLVGCDCEGSGDNSGINASESWAEPTHITAENCDGCEEVNPGSLGHGGDGTFLVDREADDEVSQWANCVNGFMACVVVEGGDEDTCIADGACPGACKAEYARLSAAAGDSIEAKLGVVDAVFFNEGALCKPAEIPGVDTMPEEPT